MSKIELEQLILLLKKFREHKDQELANYISRCHGSDAMVKAFDWERINIEKVDFTIRWVSAYRNSFGRGDFSKEAKA